MPWMMKYPAAVPAIAPIKEAERAKLIYFCKYLAVIKAQRLSRSDELALLLLYPADAGVDDQSADDKEEQRECQAQAGNAVSGGG